MCITGLTKKDCRALSDSNICVNYVQYNYFLSSTLKMMTYLVILLAISVIYLYLYPLMNWKKMFLKQMILMILDL